LRHGGIEYCHLVLAAPRIKFMTERRQAKQTREELRATLLEAGREILLEEGLEAGSSNLTFKRVFERVERKTGLRVTNASVIKRVWENQADFQADVLVAIAHDEARPEAQLTMQSVESVLGTIDVSTPESRARSLQEVCRVGGWASTTAIGDSENFSLWISVMAMATTRPLPDERRRIRAALLEGYEAVSKFWEEIFAGLAELLHVRLRQPWTMRQFVVAVTALNEGCSLRQRMSGHIDLIDRPTGPNGEDQEWTIFGAGLEALVNQFFEPDPSGGS
jgi:AcrR family transcriptional regulator